MGGSCGRVKEEGGGKTTALVLTPEVGAGRDSMGTGPASKGLRIREEKKRKEKERLGKNALDSQTVLSETPMCH